MLHILNYERPQTLEEAYQLRQKKGSAVLGGTGWLRLGEHTLRTAIDLSGLGLRYIREEGEAFSIGAYTTLRDLETDERLNAAFDGGFPGGGAGDRRGAVPQLRNAGRQRIRAVRLFGRPDAAALPPLRSPSLPGRVGAG